MHKCEKKGKILTISIAAYNVEQYIEQALKSLIDQRVIDDLEVFVIDDGGSDCTIEIAKKYAKKYSNSIFVVHKENGGYGSTVNYSVANATGKYFKLLDGDDWFETEGLVKLVEYLRGASVDMVVTPFCAGTSIDDMKAKDLYWFEKNVVLATNSLQNVHPLPMWAVAFKTELLKRCWIELPERTFYTDVLYVLHAVFYAQDLFCTNYNVYCYRVDRPGNSTNRTSLAKHYPQHMTIALMCAKYYAEKESDRNFPLLRACAAMPYVSAARALLYAPVSLKTMLKLKEYDKQLYSISPSIYSEVEKYGKTGLFLKWIRKTKYLSYWMMLLYGVKWHWRST